MEFIVAFQHHTAWKKKKRNRDCFVYNQVTSCGSNANPQTCCEPAVKHVFSKSSNHAFQMSTNEQKNKKERKRNSKSTKKTEVRKQQKLEQNLEQF